MAVCFELVVNFGGDVAAARAAAGIEPWPFTLPSGDHRIPLHRPVLSVTDGSAWLSVLPAAVGYGVAMDGSLPRFELTEAELAELGGGLYGLLARFEGYLAAMVGWDPEPLLDVDDLAADWAGELADGALPGLVLAEHLRTRLPLGPEWVPFRPGHVWLPYGSR
ncbi:hypothetical protein LG634_06090 [Streptomyces bambusae]|uniref:hypothetical protein n=1 Tax=Streptomyces bambusae TaxID=1550616 RepID=UPI001CFE75A3|nr:hypothetical protein [Streptomyces bambusae]MCB5164404.1 hypothetical protein [Streptomyces bambusae]